MVYSWKKFATKICPIYFYFFCFLHKYHVVRAVMLYLNAAATLVPKRWSLICAR